MNRKAVMAGLIALTMSAGQFSFAQGKHKGNDRGGERDHGKGHHEERHGNQPKPEHHDNRDFGRNHNRERAKGERGVGPNHAYYRGDRLPIEYRHRNYVVNHWRDHQLSAPPRGYHWVQSGNDYVLVSPKTGIISQMLLGR